jgi:hypothetical protein
MAEGRKPAGFHVDTDAAGQFVYEIRSTEATP